MADNLLDQASIILTPTASDVSKVLCVKPSEAPFGDFDFSRATEATRVNSQGLVETIGINLPRINYEGFSYDGSGNVVPESGCGSWLWESQSTNLVTYSEDFSQWTKTGTPTITSDYGVSPNGTQNGTRIEFGADERIRSNISASGDFTFSVYLKGSGVITLRDNTNVYRQNVTLTSEWARYDLSFNATITSVQIQNQTASIVDCEIWGAQVEQQSYATSYIPTNGEANGVTRNQDVCTNGATGTGLINSTEGVLYAEIAALSNDGTTRFVGLNDGSNSNRVVILYFSSANKIRAIVSSGGTKYVDVDYQLTNVLDFHKVAIKYKLNDFAFWIDGVEVATDTSLNAPIGLDRLDFLLSGANNFFGKTKALAVFPYLSDSELQSLTTI